MELLDGPAYPAELARRLGLGKANTSNHLTCLRGCGLVVAEPEGRRVRYEIADAGLADGLRMLADVVVSIDPDCRHGR
jgi:DNA-binding transcriptional ArsR family regulator